MPTSPKRTWLTRNLKVMSLVSLLQDLASELLYPILPIFLISTLGAPVAAVGLVEGLADGTAAISRLWAGAAADRGDRKRLIAVGYGLAGMAKLVVAMATVWPMVLGARVVDRLGKGIRGTPRDALIADGVDPEHRGKAFGFHRMADTTGAVLGPLLGLALYSAFNHNVRPLLWIAAIPALLSVLAVAFVHDPSARRRAIKKPADARTPVRSAIRDLQTMPTGFRRLLVPIGLFALINIPDAMLLVRSKNLGMSVPQVIGVYALYNAVYALSSYPLGALSDRISRRGVVGFGMIVFASAYIGLALAHRAAWVWALMPLYGLYTAATDGVVKAWVVDVAPPDRKGQAIGLHGAITGFGVVFAGIWAGLAWAGSGAAPLAIAGVVALAIGSWLLLGGRWLEGPMTTPSPLPASH